MNARALIDDRALPAWMNQPMPATSASATNGLREGLDARSLIDEGALPQWLRGQQPGQNGQWNAGPVAQEPLPAWLAQPPAQAGPFGPAAGPAPMSSGGVPPLRAQSMAGGQLADESALPEWLRIQGSSAGMSSPAARQAMPANNLVDPAAMPAWVRSGSASAEARFSASAAGMQGPAAPPAARKPPDSSWLTDVRVPAQPVPPHPVAGGAGSLSTEELPSWLQNSRRNADQPPADPMAVEPTPTAPDPFRNAGNLREDELPPWIQQGQGGGGQAQSPRRPERVQPGQQPGFGAAAPRQQEYARDEWEDQYGDDGQSDGYAGNPGDEAYQEWDDESRPRERRGGIFGRFRRK
jgi:hypothetical protein